MQQYISCFPVTIENANLSEQAIYTGELYYTGSAGNDGLVFGYQGRYDEMRVKHDIYCCNMRDTLDYWHTGRQFGSAPTLNQDFIECNPRKDIFADTSSPGFIVHIQNNVEALLPMPIVAEPSKMI